MIGILLVFAMILPLIAVVAVALRDDDSEPATDSRASQRISTCVERTGGDAQTCASYVFAFEQIAAACSGNDATVDAAIAQLSPGELDPALVAIAAGEPDCEALQEQVDSG